MRRSFTFALLLALFLIPCASFAADLDEVHFTQGEPHRSLDFRQYFELMTATQGPCTLSIQSEIFDSDQASSLFRTMMEDIYHLSDVTDIAVDSFSPFTLYVVRNTPLGVERHGNRLYCTVADLNSKNYLPALIDVALDVGEYWKSYGLGNYILNQAPDEAFLLSSYQEAEDLDILSLFISYFVEPFATPEEIHLSQQTAIALSRYIITHHGIAAFLKEDCIAYRQEWLKSIGVNRPYEDPLYDVLCSYSFSHSAQYPLIATNNQDHRFFLLPLYDMKTAKDVRRFLYDAEVGTQLLLSFIKEQSPAHYERISKQAEKALDVYCSTAGGSYGLYYQRTIQLQLSYGYMHELGHILVPSIQQNETVPISWQYEGLCEYFSYAIHPAYSLKRSYTYDVLHLYSKTGNAAGEGKSPNADNRAFWARVTEIYLDNAPLPATPELLDLPLFIRCMAEATSRYPQELKNSAWVTPIDPLRPRVPGNELTYAQAFCFTSYLVDQYSFSTYLDYCTGSCSFEEAFSMEYDDLRKLHMEAIHGND